MKRTSFKTGIVGVAVFVLTAFLIVPFLCTKLDQVLKVPGSLTGIDVLLGTVLLVIGATIALWCISLFLTVGRGTPAPFHPPMHFVERGPYRYSRNPMMLGAWLMLIGEALILHSPMLLVLTLCFILPGGILFVVQYEEPDLERRFGDAYAAYKKRVPRWIPRRMRGSG